MRRILQIACVLMAIISIVMPFDCMGAVQSTHASDCCKKGKCRHGKSATDCCRDMVSANAASVASLPPASHSVSSPHVVMAAVPAHVIPALYLTAWHLPQISASRGSPPDLRRSLPLLI